MRINVLAFATSLLLLSNSSLGSPQTPTSSTSSQQATMLLAKSATALTGSTALQDVMLSGTAERIAGSDDDTGTVVLKATADGHSRIDLNLSSGNRSEIRSLDTNGPVGAWSGPDGAQHAISNHNLMTDASWFFCAFTLARMTSSQVITATYIGQESLNEQTVLHVSVTPRLSTGYGQTLLQHLSQMDLFVDPATSLPVALSFNVHPDNNASLDIPVQIQFSDYRNINGVHIPFHIQKFINNSLVLDLKIQSAALNSGLPTSVFAVQIAQ
jgi:hypothetical protein